MDQNAKSKIIPLASILFVIGLGLTVAKLMMGRNHRPAETPLDAMTTEDSTKPIMDVR